ncbi:hypothetical protein K493DRAFT_219136 [Basidiobolus meristosporus CBS 931.73]|uniref:DUF803-domain-containing protein n=1 Tax=Basidiobolus meristosporus CBS 931.73 TaxID=1314790 RepID=A0A1Y1YBY7_9FUNG|nr:hypothetical protein K493DRAFT_219136 [Basidiobolus meristosporus CBS 931.73]|eukprot:ORX95453.1 hypothetical protein K493DRAFT_219136 [Basidiobolus meristosporus CBS 931.73]
MSEVPVSNYVIGFTVSLCASIADAFGANLMKRDHARNEALPPEQRKHEFLRWGWHLGLLCYVGSQVVGSTIALNFLKTQWVAPLGSAALIFNFIFARLLVGTPITKSDLYGTAIVICSVVWVVVFGGLGKDDDCNVLNITTLGSFAFAVYVKRLMNNKEKKQKIRLFRSMETIRLLRLIGMCFACIGGLFASETLLLAKSGIRLLVISISSENQFTDGLSIAIVIGLIFTAVLQLYCLNNALKYANSVVVVPLFYCFYTCVGLFNTCVYLNQFETYPWWVLLLILVGVVILVFGVRLLSQSKTQDQHHIELSYPENDLSDLELSSVSSKE